MSISEEEISTPQPTDEELNDFKARVTEWTKLDDQVKKLNIAIRERRLHQRALSDGIIKFMSTYGYGNLNTNQGRILHTVRKVKQPLKVNEVKTLILENIKLPGEELVKKIFESERPIVEKQGIRRVVPKVSMHLEI